jgi:hypothetical protein
MAPKHGGCSVKLKSSRSFVIFALVAVAFTTPAHAYIGPGAGVSLLGALFGIFSMLALFVWSLVRWAFRSVFGRKKVSAVGPEGVKAHELREEVRLAASGTESHTSTQIVETPSGAASSGNLLLVALSMFLAGVTMASFLEYPRDTLSSWRVAANHFITGFRDPLNYNHWQVDRFPTEVQGVITHIPQGTHPGLNIETTATFPSTRLFDMEGNVVHEWAQSREAMARAWAAMGVPHSDLSGLHWRRVKPLKDGSLLVIVENNRATPYGFGLMKLDATSNITWMRPGHYHHSLDIADDGTIYILYQELSEQSHPMLPRVTGPMLSEGVAVLSSDGIEQRRMDIVEAFLDTPYEGLLKDVRQDERGDPLHLNTVTIIEEDVAATTPFAEPGHLLLSLRNTNTVAILNPETGKITWAANDLWIAQHEPILTGNGRLLLFDNLGKADNYSRAIEWDMIGHKIVWQWDGTEDAPLVSEQYGAIQLLPNGNRLISETYGGRAIEVTASGEVVWEWRSPHRITGKSRRVGRLMEVIRVEPGFFEHSAFERG